MTTNTDITNHMPDWLRGLIVTSPPKPLSNSMVAACEGILKHEERFVERWGHEAKVNEKVNRF
tara:strand:- start:2478 stop:2666 length:189 start_codon:yes stop_codon:yes gene_type:complete